MHVVIFGREGCGFCVRAKQVAETIAKEQKDYTFKYVDIVVEGISKADLEKSVGKEVKTVPQIFVDNQPIGGFTEFEALMKAQELID